MSIAKIPQVPIYSRQEFEDYIEFISEDYPSPELKQYLVKQKSILIPHRSFLCKMPYKVVAYTFDTSNTDSKEKENSDDSTPNKEKIDPPKYILYQDDLQSETYLYEDFVVRKGYETNLTNLLTILKRHIFPSNLDDKDCKYLMHYDKILCYQDRINSTEESKLHICLMTKLTNAIPFTKKYSAFYSTRINPYEVNEMLVQMQKILNKMPELTFITKLNKSAPPLFPVSPYISSKSIFCFDDYLFKLSIFFCYLDEPNQKIFSKDTIVVDEKPTIPTEINHTEAKIAKFYEYWLKGLALIAAGPFVSKENSGKEINLGDCFTNLENRKNDFNKLFTADFELLTKNFRRYIKGEVPMDSDYIFPEEEFKKIKNYLLLDFLVSNNFHYKDSIKDGFKLTENISDTTDPLDHLKVLKELIAKNPNQSKIKTRESKEKDGLAIEIEFISDTNQENQDKSTQIVAEIIPFWQKQFIDFKCWSQGIILSHNSVDDLNAFFIALSEELEYINAEVELTKEGTNKAVFRSAMLVQHFDDVASNIIYSLDLLILMSSFILRKLKLEMDSEEYGWISSNSKELMAEAKGLIRKYKKLWNKHASWMRADEIAL